MAMKTCPRCGAQNEPTQWACSACALSFSEAFDHGLRAKRCPVCGGATRTGRGQLRLGGATGLSVLVAANFPDSGMSFLELQTETCMSCGHIDLYQA